MASLAQSRRFTLSARALSEIRALFTADRADEEETAATIRTVLRETGNFIDPHTAVGVAVAEKETRDPAVPMVVLVDRASGEISRRGRGGLRRAPAAAGMACRSQRPAGARRPCCRPIRRRSSDSSCATSRAAQEGAAA